MLFPLSCVCPALVASCWVHSAALGLCGQQGAVQTAYAVPWERLECCPNPSTPFIFLRIPRETGELF